MQFHRAAAYAPIHISPTASLTPSPEFGTQTANLCASQPVQNKVLLSTIVFSLLGLITQITIGLRLYSRRKLASALGIGVDDYLIVAANVGIAFVMCTGTIRKPP